MKSLLRSCMAVAVVLAAAGCVHRATTIAPFEVMVVATSEGDCAIKVDGRAIGATALPDIARSEALPNRRVHILADADTPYRCIGGVIFTLQMAGFAKIGFTSEPAPPGWKGPRR